jgi:hypothetical protein
VEEGTMRKSYTNLSIARRHPLLFALLLLLKGRK